MRLTTMYPRRRRAIRGVTILEILIAIFVMLIGITGVVALFPVGVRLSQMSADDVISAMTAQNALAAVRLQSGLLNRVKPYVADDNESGDVTAWNGTKSECVEGFTGSVANVGTPAPGDTKLQVTCAGVDGRSLDVRAAGGGREMGDNCALVLMTSGNVLWKLYRLDKNATLTQFASGATVSTCTNFPADAIVTGDTFRLIGARDANKVLATVPEDFYGSGPLDPPYELGQGAVKEYGYLAIITRVKESTSTFRVDILVFKGYDKSLPPEGNLPAIACYTTILSSDMLK